MSSQDCFSLTTLVLSCSRHCTVSVPGRYTSVARVAAQLASHCLSLVLVPVACTVVITLGRLKQQAKQKANPSYNCEFQASLSSIANAQ